MYNKEQMIKPEQDSKVEPHLLLPLNRKKEKNTKFAQYTTTKYNGKNITVIKTTIFAIVYAKIKAARFMAHSVISEYRNRLCSKISIQK